MKSRLLKGLENLDKPFTTETVRKFKDRKEDLAAYGTLLCNQCTLRETAV